MDTQVENSSQFLRAASDLFSAGDRRRAVRVCQEGIRRNPSDPKLWHFLGAIRLSEENYPAAYTAISQAIALCDTKPVYWNNLGVALLELGRYAEGEAAIRRALALNDHFADAWSNLGRILSLRMSSLDEAEVSLNAALRLSPEHPQAIVHLADIRRVQGRFEESEKLCQRVIQGGAAPPEAYKKLAQALTLLRRHGEARIAIEHGIRLAPSNGGLHYSLGMVCAADDRPDDAKRAFCRAASLPGGRTIWRWKHLGLCPAVFPDPESIDAYWFELHAGLAVAAAERPHLDWRTLPHDGFSPSFNLPHHLRCCRELKEQFAGLFQDAFPHSRPTPRANRSRARVGFLVTGGHENGFLRGLAPIASRLDRRRFEPVVFCVHREAERIRRTLKSDDIAVVPFVGRFDQTVDAIRQFGCDAMVYWKVGADPWSFFLPMARLAPVQCTSWGTHGTSGVAAVDYYLTCPFMETRDAGIDPRAHYTEQLYYLPTFPTWQDRQPDRAPRTRADFGLPEHGAVYLCPHRLPKYHPVFDGYLRAVLEQDPSGTLVILCGRASDAQLALQTRITNAIGQPLARRMIFFPSMPVEQYYQLLSLATVVLDSPAYAGGITAYDAFSYHVPVVTQPGHLAVQNYTDGLYRRMGILDLSAESQEQYVALAVHLGTKTDFREDVCRRLRERSHLIFSDPEVTCAYETFLGNALRLADNPLHFHDTP